LAGGVDVVVLGTLGALGGVDIDDVAIGGLGHFHARILGVGGGQFVVVGAGLAGVLGFESETVDGGGLEVADISI